MSAQAQSEASPLSTKNNVIWRLHEAMNNLLPYNNEKIYEASEITMEIWESLNITDMETGKQMPRLASLPEISEDGLSYTYHLNKDARWSDGEEVTGEDVLFSLKLILSPEITASLFGFDIDTCYVDKWDSRKITIHTTWAYSLASLQLGNIPILPKHIFDPLDLSRSISWSDFNNKKLQPIFRELAKPFDNPKMGNTAMLVGSGPYKVAEWREQGVLLERNEQYWGTNIPGLEAYPQVLSYVVIEDDSLAGAAFANGMIDIIAPRAANTLESMPRFKLITSYRNYAIHIAWNLRKTLFKEKEVRKALTMLINRSFMLTALSNERFKLMEGPVYYPPANPASGLRQPEYNPAIARQLLYKAGWEDTDNDGILDKTIRGKRTKFKFTLTVPDDPTLIQTASWIKNAMEREGLVVQLDIDQDYGEHLKKKKFDAALAVAVPDGNERDFYWRWHSKGVTEPEGDNIYSFKSKRVDQLLEDMAVEFDLDAREELLEQFQKEIIEEQPATFLFTLPLTYYCIDRFDNIKVGNMVFPPINPRYWRVRNSGHTRTDNRKG